MDDAQPTGAVTLAPAWPAAVGVSPATKCAAGSPGKGLVPGYELAALDAEQAVAYVRVVAARLRSTRAHIRARSSRPATTGSSRSLFPDREPAELLAHGGRTRCVKPRARAGLTAELIRRISPRRWASAPRPPRAISDEDVRDAALRRRRCSTAGFPPPAFLQLMRVYGQVIAQIADAEVRLVHLYVHEPMMRAGVPNVEIAEEMEGLARAVLPFATPFIAFLHGRLLSHFVEQDMIGHMEAELDDGRARGGPAARRDRLRRPGRLRAADRRAGR